MSTKKAEASKKEEPKADATPAGKAKEKNGSKGKEKDAVEAKAEAKAEPKKAKKEADEKEEAPKAEKAEAKPAKAPKSSTNAKVYQQSNSYAVGEMIFHPVWKTEGTVVEVGKTPDGNTKILVDFGEGFGMKRLIAELQAKL